MRHFLSLVWSLYYSEWIGTCVDIRACSVVSESMRPPWTIAHQAPLSMEFSRQEYWIGLPFPSLGDIPHPGIEPMSPESRILDHWAIETSRQLPYKHKAFHFYFFFWHRTIFRRFVDRQKQISHQSSSLPGWLTTEHRACIPFDVIQVTVLLFDAS